MTTSHEPEPQPNSERGAALRQRYFELAGGAGEAATRERLRREIAQFELEALVEFDGLGLSPYPCARYSAPRMVEAARLPAQLRERFARPVAQLPELAAAFVDPAEFSYRSFENILPLDRYFSGLSLEVGLEERTPLGKARDVEAYHFGLAASPEVAGALRGLDELGLYVAPLNAASRGGRRFIFHSAALSEALGEAVRAALPRRWLKGFAHVNPVFRCNRFEPGDAPFSRHVDTPYFDRSRQQISRYTLLIYLTGGESDAGAEPALSVGEDIELRELGAMSCVVFPQDRPHAGAPFAVGRKVFLRTELVFTADEGALEHAPETAALFAKACYLSGEATVRPQLGARMHELYDRAALAHWSADPGSVEPEPHFHKRFRGVEFVTNGHDYWFSKGHLDLRECAAVAILDLLNCKIGGQVFRRQADSRVLTPPAHRARSEWAMGLLADTLEARREDDPVFMALDVDALLPEPERIDDSHCCPFHAMPDWDATRHGEVVDLYTRAQSYVRRRLGAVPVTLMGQELFLDLDKFVVGAGKIHVLSEHAMEPLNFAACWNDGSTPSNYVHAEGAAQALHLLVPPLLFVEHARGYHLMADLFRNSWMVAESRHTIPIPRIHNLPMDGEAYQDFDWDEFCARSPWLEAAARGCGLEPDADEDEGSWWDWEETVMAKELEQVDTPPEELELFGPL